MIAAMSANRVIGINNDLPWHLPDDMKFFMETTKHHSVVMGRKNYESIPLKYRPLPNRKNLVVTRQSDYSAEGCQLFENIESAIAHAREEDETLLFIIGGGQIYEQSIELVDVIYLTEINTHIENGDVFFPQLDGTWQEVSRRHHPVDDLHKFSFDYVTYERNILSS